MKHIFISHAGADAEIANRLASDLRNAGHETKIDTKELRLGDDTIEFINNGISQAHSIIILYSKHTANAKWQKLEINSAVWNETAQDGGTCIVLKLDDSEIPPILGPKIYGTLNMRDKSAYKTLLEDICTVIISGRSASSIVSDAFRPDSVNPFRRIRAEFFEDEPNLLAKMFAPPDALKTGLLEEMKPCFLEGSRGTGKSMLILSLRARNYISRLKKKPSSLQLFGFYLKLNRGAICNAGILSEDNNDLKALIGQDALQIIQITDIASQELVVCIIESLLSEITFCIKNGLLACDPSIEKHLSESVQLALFGTQSNLAKSIDDLLEILADTHRSIANFIRRRFIYSETISVPIAIFDLEALKRVIGLVKKIVSPLANSMFVVLLDEFENLFSYQQKIINGFIKLGTPYFSVKIAKKLGTSDTSSTTTGQELQETHDYTRLSLVYDVEDDDQFRAYLDLLNHFLNNIIIGEGQNKLNIAELLPTYNTLEVGQEKIISEVANLCKVSAEDFQTWNDEKKKEKLTYYREAAIYRVLYSTKGRHKEKCFSGFNELAFISSGVIRYFQEIMGVAYHLTYGSSMKRPSIISFPSENQSKAVHLVSEHNLTTLSRNVEKYGERLKYFLLDLGDCLRHKLLKNTSEPEAARLTITDPEHLQQTKMLQLKRLLDVGVREGVLQTKEGRPAFKPKHRSDPQPTEFNISRIYAPVLQISPRLRWRSPVSCVALLGLISWDKRAQAVQQIKAQMVKIKNTQPKLL
jgi:hypothetical protein